MCGGGAARREHHRQQEQMREETRIRNMYEEAQRQADLERKATEARMAKMQQEADTRQQEAIQAIRAITETSVETSKAPFKVKTAADATTPLIRTRKKPPGRTKGVASLRINRTPGTNLGTGTSGTNVT